MEEKGVKVVPSRVVDLLGMAVAFRASVDAESEAAANGDAEARITGLRNLSTQAGKLVDSVERYLAGCLVDRFVSRPREELAQTARQLGLSLKTAVEADVASWQNCQANMSRLERILPSLPVDIAESRRQAILGTPVEFHRQSMGLLQKGCMDLQDWLMGVRDELEPSSFVMETSPLRYLEFVRAGIRRDEDELEFIEKTANDGYPAIALSALYRKGELAKAETAYLAGLMQLSSDFTKTVLSCYPATHSTWTAAIWDQLAQAVGEVLRSSSDSVSQAIDDMRASYDLAPEKKISFILSAWRTVDSTRTSVIDQWCRLL